MMNDGGVYYNFIRESGIKSSSLKVIAMIIMFFDHVGASILEKYLMVVTDYDAFMRIYHMDMAIRTVGRIAFPIFCYQLVMGERYTSSKIKYFRNMLIFCVISEIPFDLAINDGWFDLAWQNVYFTLAIGLGMIICLDKIREKGFSLLIQIATVIPFGLLAYFLKTDYSFAGIVLIASIYFCIDDRRLLMYVPTVSMLCVYFVQSLVNYRKVYEAYSNTCIEAVSALGFLLISMDNGVRKGGKVFKWVSYFVYPVHLLLLFGVRYMILKF